MTQEQRLLSRALGILSDLAEIRPGEEIYFTSVDSGETYAKEVLRISNALGLPHKITYRTSSKTSSITGGLPLHYYETVFKLEGL